MDTIALSDLRADLPGIIKKLSQGWDRLIVTVSGKPKVAMMNLEELEALEETADILSEPGALAEIKQGIREAKKGRGIPLRDLL